MIIITVNESQYYDFIYKYLNFLIFSINMKSNLYPYINLKLLLILSQTLDY